MIWHPDSDGRPELFEATTPIHSDKWHRCIGHVRDANAKRGTSYDEYGVCTSSIGYAGSVNPEHRRKPRGYQSPPIAGRTKGPGIRRARTKEAAIRENQKDIVAKYGITELDFPSPTSTIRHIGYSPREKKWFGWSHRAVAGFGIGSTVKPGDVLASGDMGPEFPFPPGYTAKTMDDAKALAAAFALAVS